jgi:hypothetical protein
MKRLNHRRPARRRLWVALAAAFSVTAAGVTTGLTGVTSATFAETEAATGTLAAAWPSLTPVQSYLPATPLALDARGGLYEWGYRYYGLAGTGASATSPAYTSVAGRVTLPDSRKIELVAAGSRDNAATWFDYEVGIAALATDGTVWVWGTNSNRRAGILAGLNGSYILTPTRVCFEAAGLTTSATTCAAGIAQPNIIDLKSTQNTFIALDDQGNLYTWGGYAGGTGGGQVGYSASSNGTNLYSYWPRKILTGVHSFGVGVYNVWAVVTDGWTQITYSASDATPPEDFANTPTAPGSAGVLFWGSHQVTHGGGARGDGSATSGIVLAPQMVASTSPIMTLFKANKTTTADCATAAVKGDNCRGVRQGAADDGGFFQQMTGTNYGSAFLLADGSLLTWGDSDKCLAGTTATMTSLGDLLPQRVWLNPGSSDAQRVRAAKLAPTHDVMFILDETGTVWLYGTTAASGGFPAADGSPIGTSACVTSPLRVDGGTSHPEWAAGSILDVAGFGNSVMVVHNTSADMNPWIAGGAVSGTLNNGVSLSNKNEYSIVRDTILSGSSVATDAVQPLTRITDAALA